VTALREQPRCGRIAYTNDLPVYAGFDEGIARFPHRITADVPSGLNRALLEGRLDISPISSAFYAQHPDDFVLLPDVCIASKRDVRSIACISAVPPDRLASRPIAVTMESETGRMLFGVICRTWYGFQPVLQTEDDPFSAYARDGSPCLLIGDRAIDAADRARPEHVYDLGALWHAFTGAGMVYAVWAARRAYAAENEETLAGFAAELGRSKDWGLQHIDEVIVSAQRMRQRPAGFYEDYYDCLTFDFDEAAQKDLMLFFDVAKKAGLLSEAPALEFLRRVRTRTGAGARSANEPLAGRAR